MTDVWVGLDIGTTAIKAAAYDAFGHKIAAAETDTDSVRSSDGVSEQSPDAVWHATAACARELSGQLDAHSVLSIGICAQGDGFWALDRKARPVRNAILWNDTRTDIVRDLAALEKSGAVGSVGLGCQTALWPGTSALGWRWLRAHDPAAAKNVHHILTCGDWIGSQLTGNVATDFSNASIPFLDLATNTYGTAVQDLGCDDARDLLCPPQAAQSLLGRVTADAAAATGLPVGVPVSVATLDLGAMIVGMDMYSAGDTMMILGTTAVVNILTDQVMPQVAPIGATVRHSTARDIAIRVLAPSTGAAAFDWFASLHPQSLGGDTADAVAAKLNNLVNDVPVGSNGVTFLPYLNGERAPFVAPDIRAGFLGLSSATSKAELGRAVMEGTALSMRHCFESEGGLPKRPVQLTGGGSKNPVWCQVIADVIGQDILVNPKSDLGLWGAACIGASAAGQGAVKKLSPRKSEYATYRCNRDNHQRYHAVFERYSALSEAVRAAQAQESL